MSAALGNPNAADKSPPLIRGQRYPYEEGEGHLTCMAYPGLKPSFSGVAEVWLPYQHFHRAPSACSSKRCFSSRFSKRAHRWIHDILWPKRLMGFRERMVCYSELQVYAGLSKGHHG